MSDELDERLDAALASHAAKVEQARQVTDARKAEMRANEEAWERICDAVVQPSLEAVAARLVARDIEAVVTKSSNAVGLAFLPADSGQTLATVSTLDRPWIRFEIHGMESCEAVVHQSTMTPRHGGKSGELKRLMFDDVTAEEVTRLAVDLAEEVLSY
jgi:hypothetical protein